MLKVLERTDVDAPTLARARMTIDRQLKQLVRLVDDLLDLNRVTHNRLELRPKEVELSTVMDEVLDTAKPLLDAARHELHVDMPEEPIHLVADPARLAQVFGNLVNNACKYTPPGGSISIRVERRGTRVRISVKDTGIGIPPEKREAIFEMFTQLDHSLVRSQGGLGIGLTLVKQLVEVHDGSIEVRSPGVGHGSEFVVDLPIVEATPTKGVSEPVVTRRPPKLKRILVVDDNLDAAESLSMLLELSGTQTYLAHDGAEALDAVKKHRPDAVLLDLGLPDASGLDVCRQIRAEPWGKELVLIALTGWGQEDDRRASKEAGFDGHLVKPVDHAELEELLRAVAMRRDAAADDEARLGS
jgi:CheY-like chemotaxis protein